MQSCLNDQFTWKGMPVNPQAERTQSCKQQVPNTPKSKRQSQHPYTVLFRSLSGCAALSTDGYPKIYFPTVFPQNLSFSQLLLIVVKAMGSHFWIHSGRASMDSLFFRVGYVKDKKDPAFANTHHFSRHYFSGRTHHHL